MVKGRKPQSPAYIEFFERQRQIYIYTFSLIISFSIWHLYI